MKKLKFLFASIMLFVFVGVHAQPKPEKKAKKITDEMTEVLSLNKKESKEVYDIQLARFTEAQAIRKEYSDQPEVQKEKLKALGNKLYNQMKNAIGPERQKQWKEYKKNN